MSVLIKGMTSSPNFQNFKLTVSINGGQQMQNQELTTPNQPKKSWKMHVQNTDLFQRASSVAKFKMTEHSWILGVAMGYKK